MKIQVYCLSIFLVFAALLVALPVVSAAEYESRIWSSKGGKFEVRAKFVDLVDETVRLERPNGDITRVPLGKLSEKDQEYVRNAKPVEKLKAATAPSTPQGLKIGDRVEVEDFRTWKTGVVADIDYEWDDIDVRLDESGRISRNNDLDDLRYPGTNRQPILIKPQSPSSMLKSVRPDMSDVKRLVADGNPASQIAAEPLESTSWSPRGVRLGKKRDFFEQTADFAIVSGAEPRALVIYRNVHHKDVLPRIELVDLQAKKVVAGGPAPEGAGKLALSPSGSSFATMPARRGGSDSTGQVDFWKLNEKKVEHWTSFSPYVMNTWPNIDPEWAAWLDDERLFTVNNEGQLILWRIEGAKAIYELLVEGGTKPILTHGRKHLVVPTTFGIQFFDADSGELAAAIESGNALRSRLAFSPSGKQLAIVSSGFVDVVDVTTGETTRSFPVEGAARDADVCWVDEEYLFLGNGLIVNVPLRIVAWKFETFRPLIKSFVGHQWVLLENPTNGTRLLTPLELPPEVKSAVENIDEENLLVAKPGDSISIDVQISDRMLAEEVREALTDALHAAGMKVAEDAPLKLVARTSNGETKTINYRRFGQFRGDGESIQVTDRVYQLELKLNGTVVWERRSIHSAPMHLSLQEGESIRSAISRVMKPKAGSFQGRLPAYVVRPEYREPLGKSKLTFGF